MRIAVTGASGFLGHYIVNHLAARGHACRCWFRPRSDRGGFEAAERQIEWIPGELGDTSACSRLVDGCDSVVHAALYYPRTISPREMAACWSSWKRTSWARCN